MRWRGGGISLGHRRDFIQQLQSLSGDGPSMPMELNPKEFQGFHLAMLNKVLCATWCCSLFKRSQDTFSDLKLL